ncbi:MAG: hypothetical protein NXH95_02585 [Pseudomonadaceae bacterium]|nr:hypothetical protein [Pseudomonadaceae bacterium]
MTNAITTMNRYDTEIGFHLITDNGDQVSFAVDEVALIHEDRDYALKVAGHMRACIANDPEHDYNEDQLVDDLRNSEHGPFDAKFNELLRDWDQACGKMLDYAHVKQKFFEASGVVLDDMTQPEWEAKLDALGLRLKQHLRRMENPGKERGPTSDDPEQLILDRINHELNFFARGIAEDVLVDRHKPINPLADELVDHNPENRTGHVSKISQLDSIPGYWFEITVPGSRYEEPLVFGTNCAGNLWNKGEDIDTLNHLERADRWLTFEAEMRAQFYDYETVRREAFERRAIVLEPLTQEEWLSRLAYLIPSDCMDRRQQHIERLCEQSIKSNPHHISNK